MYSSVTHFSKTKRVCMGTTQSSTPQCDNKKYSPNFQPLWNIDVVMVNILQYSDGASVLNCLVCNRTFYRLIMNREFLIDRITNSNTYPVLPTTFIENHDIPLTEITNWMTLNNSRYQCHLKPMFDTEDHPWKTLFQHPVYGTIARVYMFVVKIQGE